jgi:hypothetical protein
MTSLLIIILCLNLSDDSLIVQSNIKNAKKNYSKQILVNGLIGIGFGISTGIFYKKGADAFEDYKESTSARSALENWNKTMLYDNLRNICAVGTVIFTLRAVYYQIKNIKASKAARHIIIDFNYCRSGKWSFGLEKRL